MVDCFKKLKHQTALVFKKDERITELTGASEKREKDFQAMKAKLDSKCTEVDELSSTQAKMQLEYETQISNKSIEL